jgi:hypothetical protein
MTTLLLGTSLQWVLLVLEIAEELFSFYFIRAQTVIAPPGVHVG